ncbi:MAG: helix-turn-helix domain-containing protein [Patescibacteria group bacterium]
MKLFKKNKIFSEIDFIAEELRYARQAKKLSLQEISKKLNINYKYLNAFEKGDLGELPAGLYGKNFLKEYALFLGLNYEEILKIYEGSILVNSTKSTKNTGKRRNREIFSKQIIKGNKFLIAPKIVKGFFIVTLASICFIYLGICLNRIISPPELYIIGLQDNLVTSNNFVIVSGITEPEAQVIINGELILIDSADSFNKRVNLKSGINTITITAKKKYSREKIIKKQILVNNQTYD